MFKIPEDLTGTGLTKEGILMGLVYASRIFSGDWELSHYSYDEDDESITLCGKAINYSSASALIKGKESYHVATIVVDGHRIIIDSPKKFEVDTKTLKRVEAIQKALIDL